MYAPITHHSLKLGAAAMLALLALAPLSPLCAQERGAEMIGNRMTLAEFQDINRQAKALIEAVKPTSEPLSAADEKMLGELYVASRGMFEASEAARRTADHPMIRTYAQAEADELTLLGTKLKEIAAAKKLRLNLGISAVDKKSLGELGGEEGSDFDEYYIYYFGVKGHQKMFDLTKRISTTATDPALKQLADSILPVIQRHRIVAEGLEELF